MRRCLPWLAAAEISEATLLSSHHALANLFSRFMERPVETLEAPYHYLLPELLELHFQEASSVLMRA